jgi:hypothetical protein
MQTSSTDPLNTLEIISSASSPYFSSTNGSSGLKFRNMNSTNTPVANPGLGVLGLDNAGNVIYVQGGTGNGIGNCTTPTLLTGTDGAINLNGLNFRFLGQGTPGYNVSVGIPCGQ